MTDPVPGRVYVVIPALNEEAALPHVLDGLPREEIAGVIVADNGSADRTAEVARNHSAVVVQEPRRGYGAACLAGLAYLRRQGMAADDIVLFIDGDFSDDPRDASRVTAPIRRDEADLVIGSRVRGKSDPGALTLPQRVGNLIAVTMIAALTGVRYTDLGPFRAIRWSALERLTMADTNFGWTVEMQLKAARRGMRIGEVPVRYRNRHSGTSKVSGSVVGSFLAGYKIIATIFRYAYGPTGPIQP